MVMQKVVVRPTSTHHDFFYKFGATATWKMTKICSYYVRQRTTSLWDHYVARISFEVDRHLAVHNLGRTTSSHNLKCRTTHIAPTVHTTKTTTCFTSHNHVVQSRTTKFLSVWMHLKSLNQENNIYYGKYIMNAQNNVLGFSTMIPAILSAFKSRTEKVGGKLFKNIL